MLGWFKSNHQALTAIGAMVVGLAALFVAWDQARVMRAQQHGAVIPVIQIDGFTSRVEDTMSMGLRFMNNGVGPAMIESVRVYRDGQLMTDFEPIMTLLPEGYDRSWTSINGRVLAAGAHVEPITLSWPADDLAGEGLDALLAEWELWSVNLCYCSVFDRCWEGGSDDSARTAIPHCVRPETDVFDNSGRNDARGAEQ